VYRYLTDPETYPDWLVGAARIRNIEPSFPVEGAHFDHAVGLGGPLTIPDDTVSRGADDDRRLALRVNAGPFHADVEFQLTPTPDGCTDIRFTETPVGLFAAITPLLRRSLKARNRESLRRLGHLVTSGATGSRPTPAARSRRRA
jgi:uncharacterized protein YndB with AHSA1/START domain